MHSESDVVPAHQIGGYHEFAPPPDLARAVEALWIHQAADVRLTTHLVVPDAAVSLCFMGPRAPDGSAGGARLRIIGPVNRPHAFEPPPGHRMDSVRIKLEWCRLLLGVAPWEHMDAEPLYTDVRSDLAAPLEARLARTTSSPDVLRVLIDFLRARLSAQSERRRGIGTLLVAVASLRHRMGQPRIAELAAKLRMSDRHLRRLMIDETGVSPRQFARIQRLHALLRSADAAARPAWAELAFRHGFADQPHLIREVQDLVGVTPARLHAQRRAE
jgi:AraC-like DNA-binding protein